MPYKNLAQAAAFHAKLKRGEISAKTVHEFDEASKGMHLPEGPDHMAKGGMACPACGFAFGGEVGDYAQRKIEDELDDVIDDEDDDKDERAMKEGMVHAGVSVGRAAVGGLMELSEGGEVPEPSEEERFRQYAKALRRRR